ncbi:MAG: hypothetical protein QM775_12550 [Pirellulales bacterium]
MPRRYGFLPLLCVALTTANVASIRASENAGNIAGDLQMFLRQHCLDCHGPDVQESDLRLDTLSGDLHKPEMESAWTNVLARIEHGEMPPRGEPRPQAASLRKAVSSLQRHLAEAARATAPLRPAEDRDD